MDPKSSKTETITNEYHFFEFRSVVEKKQDLYVVFNLIKNLKENLIN